MSNILLLAATYSELLLLSFKRGDFISFFNLVSTSRSYTQFYILLVVFCLYKNYFYFFFTIIYIRGWGATFFIRTESFFNIGLNNSFSVLHPLVLLISLLGLYFILFRTTSKPYRFALKKANFAFLFLAIYAMFLGSFWSAQEVFWDGFWNWDYIEFAILFTAFLFLWSTHTPVTRFSSYLSVLILLFFIKFGTITPFLSSVHSFSGAPLMFFSPINTAVVFLFLTTSFFLVFNKRFIAIKIFLVVYFIAYYSLDLENSKNIFRSRNLLFTSFLCFLLFSTSPYRWFQALTRLPKLYFFKNYYTHIFIICLFHYYFIFLSKTIFITQLENTLSTFPKYSIYGGVTSSYTNTLSNLHNIYFSSCAINNWYFSEPTLDYIEFFTT